MKAYVWTTTDGKASRTFNGHQKRWHGTKPKVAKLRIVLIPILALLKISYNNLSSKFLYINTQYLGLISILDMTPTQPWWKGGT